MRFGLRRSPKMPLFYFNVRGDGYEVPDLAGRECPDAEAARIEAERMAADLVETALLAGERPMEAIVEVDDEELRPILAIPLNPAKG
jgi:hypothetical protein